MTTHPAAYVDWVCPGCKEMYYVDPAYIGEYELCEACERQEEDRDDD